MTEETKPEVVQETTEPKTLSVTLRPEQWQAIVQLMSVGTRHSDDSVLAIGGNLIAEVKSQLK